MQNVNKAGTAAATTVSKSSANVIVDPTPHSAGTESDTR